MGVIGVWQQAEQGVKRKILQTGDGIMMMEVRFEAGAEGYAHSHPHEQMTYCLDGKFEFHIDGEQHLLKTGEVLYIPSGAVHGVRALESGGLLDAFTPVREDLLGADDLEAVAVRARKVHRGSTGE